jgi:hypothetical protein
LTLADGLTAAAAAAAATGEAAADEPAAAEAATGEAAADEAATGEAAADETTADPVTAAARASFEPLHPADRPSVTTTVSSAPISRVERPDALGEPAINRA